MRFIGLCEKDQNEMVVSCHISYLVTYVVRDIIVKGG